MERCNGVECNGMVGPNERTVDWQRVDVSEPHKLGDFAAAMTTADGAELQSVLAERALEV